MPLIRNYVRRMGGSPHSQHVKHPIKLKEFGLDPSIQVQACLSLFELYSSLISLDKKKAKERTLLVRGPR